MSQPNVLITCSATPSNGLQTQGLSHRIQRRLHRLQSGLVGNSLRGVPTDAMGLGLCSSQGLCSSPSGWA